MASTAKRSRLAHFGNARSEEQIERMCAAEDAGQCSFCPEFVQREVEEGTRDILRRGEHWFVTTNEYPYENTRLHLLVTPHRHVEHFNELTDEEGLELFDHLRWAMEKYELEYGAIGIRFGNMEGTGGSIAHLHAHLVVAELDPAPGSKRVRFPMGPKPPKGM